MYRNLIELNIFLYRLKAIVKFLHLGINCIFVQKIMLTKVGCGFLQSEMWKDIHIIHERIITLIL